MEPAARAQANRVVFVATVLVMVIGASVRAASEEAGVFTLYRTSIVDPNMVVHVATFDTSNGSKYNSENCWLAAELFMRQPGVKTKFWCQPGRAEK